jgi:hypothetical protein
MQKPKIMKEWKAIGILFLFVLPAITVTNSLGISTSNILDVDDNSINKGGIKNENEDLHAGFIFGRWGSLVRYYKYLIITADILEALGFLYLNPMTPHELDPGQQIKITDFKIGVITANYIAVCCKIVVPHAIISMDVSAHNDSENSIVWKVNKFSGDAIWMPNLRLNLYNESGERPFTGWGYTLKSKYLGLGDEIKITVDEDGYYSFKVTECVSKDILFESNLVKY